MPSPAPAAPAWRRRWRTSSSLAPRSRCSRTVFCDRITEMGRRYGANVVRFEKPWGETFDDARQPASSSGSAGRGRLRPRRDFDRRLQPGKAICEAAHRAGAIVIADCVTSLGSMPVKIDEMGVDVAYSCSKRAELPAGTCAGHRFPPRAGAFAGADQPHGRGTRLETARRVLRGSARYHHTAPSRCSTPARGLAIIAERAWKSWKPSPQPPGLRRRR